MKSIFVINDNSPEAVHAVEFALAIAQKMQANILLANTADVNKMISIKVPAGTIPENVLFDPTMVKGIADVLPASNPKRNLNVHTVLNKVLCPLANMSKSGFPEVTEKYARSVFSEEVCLKVNYDRLFFNNVKEKDLNKAIDLLINGMQNDVLVLVNRCFHFMEILGRYITDALPLHITIPLLVFPY
jgi:hypothetical protein